MKFLDIKDAQSIAPDDSVIDLILVTDEGEIPFTFAINDDAPASLFVRERLASLTVEPYIPPAQPSMEEFQVAKKEEIRQAWLNEINNVGMPIEGYDFNVDFGVEDALIWQESVQFVAPEATEVEVRAIDNTFHTIPKSVYESIPALQKTYYAQMLQKKWGLQKQADNTATIEELEQIKW